MILVSRSEILILLRNVQFRKMGNREDKQIAREIKRAITKYNTNPESKNDPDLVASYELRHSARKRGGAYSTSPEHRTGESVMDD